MTTKTETVVSHTPGPWRHTGTGIDAKAFDGSWKWLTPVVHGGNPSQATANRALMAAAPDLLAALKLIESVYRQNCVAVGEPSSVLHAVQAAIAKAEGGR